MTTSKFPEKLAVDANPILSAVIGGKALRIFWELNASLYTTEHTLKEVIGDAPRLDQKAGVPLREVLASLHLLPLTTYGRTFYRAKLPQARVLIGRRDPDDVDLLALALKLGIPVWTNNKDFEIAKFPIYTAAELLSLLDHPHR